MKQDIENIIKKWLKEHKDDGQYVGDYDGEFDLENCCLDGDFDLNDLADEVLKVVVEKIREEVEETFDGISTGDDSGNRGLFEAKQIVLELLTNLSPNKENKNNE